MKLKTELIQRLERLGVTHQEWPDRDDGFSTLHFADKEIAHFHHFHELDLKLGKKLIQANKLEHPTDSLVHPKRKAGSQYIELPLSTKQHLNHIVDLISQWIEENR